MEEDRRHGEKIQRKNSLDNGNRNHMDQTIELVVNLNLDPRKPGQSLRGSIDLPNGTGKAPPKLAVFTLDDDLKQKAIEAGASHAGGEELIERVASGELPVDSIERSLATPDAINLLQQKAARLLGPRGIMPNAKNQTLVNPEQLIPTINASGKNVLFRTDRSGIIHLPVGKISFGTQRLIENIGHVMKHIFSIQPEQYGKNVKKGKKASKNAQYLLKTFVTSTQGSGVLVDRRTVDPNSPFFLQSTETITIEQEKPTEMKM